MVCPHYARKKNNPKTFYYLRSPWRQGRESGLCKVNCARMGVQGISMHKGMTVPWYKPWPQTSFTALGWEGTVIRSSTSLCGSFRLYPDPSWVPELLLWSNDPHKMQWVPKAWSRSRRKQTNKNKQKTQQLSSMKNWKQILWITRSLPPLVSSPKLP